MAKTRLGSAIVLAAATIGAQATAATPATVTYSYDSLGRVVKDDYPTNQATYTYDKAGNRTKSTTTTK
ncbi:hypothetical protein ACFW16_33880 [Inquilinus sp. NPDC058860]|uniref:hypothetical protein n=1 Tax=Inquilinus sp. NPDC058860 TaxID=3346652 RepID=UPI0036A04E4E